MSNNLNKTGNFTWYNKASNGFIMSGGFYRVGSAIRNIVTVISFPSPYTDYQKVGVVLSANYSFTSQTNSGAVWSSTSQMNNTGFRVYTYGNGSGDLMNAVSWIATGY